nr:MAG TPA: hypothetical protein [Caudoviricetes sp.]
MYFLRVYACACSNRRNDKPRSMSSFLSAMNKQKREFLIRLTRR